MLQRCGSACRGPRRIRGGCVPILVLGLFATLALVPGWETPVAADNDLIGQGEQIFRFDTFGDEQLWTDKLGMHQVIESSIDPTTALQLGLKIDVDALPDEVIIALQSDQVNLTDPEVTVALIKLEAVVGLAGSDA